MVPEQACGEGQAVALNKTLDTTCTKTSTEQFSYFNLLTILLFNYFHSETFTSLQLQLIIISMINIITIMTLSNKRADYNYQF